MTFNKTNEKTQKKRIRRFFFENGPCAYEIEKAPEQEMPRLDERLMVRLFSGRHVFYVTFTKKEKTSLIQFANDLLEMASKL